MEQEIEEKLKEIYKNIKIQINFIEFRKYEIITRIKHLGTEFESKIIYKLDTSLTLDANISRIVNIIDYKIIIPFYKKGV